MNTPCSPRSWRARRSQIGLLCGRAPWPARCARPYRRTGRGSRRSCRDGCSASRTTKGSDGVSGMRPPTAGAAAPASREIGERHDGALADAQHLPQHPARLARRLQGLAQDHVVEGVGGIVAQVGVGVALDHRQPARHAGVDAGLADLDAARVDPLEVQQLGEQRAVAAADVERARRRSTMSAISCRSTRMAAALTARPSGRAPRRRP